MWYGGIERRWDTKSIKHYSLHILSKMCAVVLCFKLPVECGPMEAAVCGELICRELIVLTYLINMQ